MARIFKTGHKNIANVVVRRMDDSVVNPGDYSVNATDGEITYTGTLADDNFKILFDIGTPSTPPTVYSDILMKSFFLDATNPATTDNIGKAIGLLKFLPGVLGKANFSSEPIPQEWLLGSDMSLVLDLVSLGTSAGNAKFDINYSLTNTGESFVGDYLGFGNTATVSVPSTANEVFKATINIGSAPLLPGKLFHMTLTRDGANVIDTHTDAIIVVNSRIRFQKQIIVVTP